MWCAVFGRRSGWGWRAARPGRSRRAPRGCNGCIAYGMKSAKEIGLSAERLMELPAWRESALYDDAERAGIALTEAMTRLADHPDAVTDEIWAEAAQHFDEPALSALVSMV